MVERFSGLPKYTLYAFQNLIPWTTMSSEVNYRIPSATRIGHVHLKVSDLERSLGFYCDLLGFNITTRLGNEAVFLSAGGYHHHIGLNVWYSKGSQPGAHNVPGLFHTAILYPDRKELALIYSRILYAGYPLSGAADHGVSEALYLDDPDRNGVELCWDRPSADWPKNPDGSLRMYTRPLDLANLKKLAED
jgi:catechol 2,3-dioxygenase